MATGSLVSPFMAHLFSTGRRGKIFLTFVFRGADVQNIQKEEAIDFRFSIRDIRDVTFLVA